MGAVTANLLEGEPCWLMLVGPPSSGKTVLLESLLGMDGVHDLATISGGAAFLSATPKSEQSRDSTGGILRQVGEHGAAVINDFTSVLSLRKDALDEVLSVFRESFRGIWTRSVGAEGGRMLRWEGKVAYFGGVTGVIDQYQQTSASLGERWIYCRMDEGDGFERAKRALRRKKTKWKLELQQAVLAFFAGLDLEFGKLDKCRELTDTETVKVIRMGTLAAKCRSGVLRDPYSKEVIGARETESETRLVTVMGQLLIGMEVIGVNESERWRLLWKVALDSMPRLRSLAIEEVMATTGSEGAGMEEITKRLGCSRSTADRTVEDLEIHGVLVRHKDNGKVRVTLNAGVQLAWRKT